MYSGALIATDEKYLVLCGVIGLGRLMAMALQRLDDADLPRCQRIVDSWAGDALPLVLRAGIAALCEPRLLTTQPAAVRAVDLCDRVTASLAARPPTERRAEDVRTLRKALGYCWSVAVAATPAHGLPAFHALEHGSDPDIAWIVRQNRTKSRLATLL